MSKYQTVSDIIAERDKAQADLAAAQKTNKEWLVANGPGGWIDKLRSDLAAARADATLLRSTLIDIAAVMGMSSLPSYSEWEKIRNKALQLVAALAGERKP